MFERLICLFKGHDWMPIYGQATSNIRRCSRCLKIGWEV